MLQAIITWTKKSSKGCREWRAACVNVKLWPRILKTQVKTMFASCVILFQETFEYMNAINLCYGHQAVHLQAWISNGQTWAIMRIVIDILLPMLNQCILNLVQWFLVVVKCISCCFYLGLWHETTSSSYGGPLLAFDPWWFWLRASMYEASYDGPSDQGFGTFLAFVEV
jgi:hypothetical protein